MGEAREYGRGNLPAPLKTKYLSSYETGRDGEIAEVKRPIFEYPDRIFLGVSGEASQLGLKKPQFFMEIPDQYIQQIVDITAGIREDLIDKTVSSRPMPRKTDVSVEEETIIAILVMKPKVSEAIRNLRELDDFLAKHKESMQELDDNKRSKDYLRMPTLEDIEVTIGNNQRGMTPEKVQAAASKVVDKGAIVTIEESDYEGAVEARKKMLKAIEWMEKCAKEKIDILELLEYLRQCFLKGKYPDVEKPPTFAGIARLSNLRD